MKRLVLFVAMLFFLTFAYSQKEIAQVSFNKYEVSEVLSGELTQVGYFKMINGKVVRHGLWKLFKNGEVVKQAYYENDELKWIECKVNGKFTRDQLRIESLKRKVERLEAEIVASNE